MNNRQEGLYKYLQEKAITTKAYISKEEICKDLHELYPREKEKTNEHNSTAFNWLRTDVSAINQSDEGMIIASNKIGYKIADEKQAKEYLKNYQIKHLRGLKRYWNMLKKAQENGQLSMTDDGLVEIRRMLEGIDNGRQ